MTLNLDAIKARAEAATKGPWASGRDWGTITSGPDSVAHGWHETTCPECDGTVYTQGHVSISVEDLEFITASRTDVPALVAEVERLRAIVDSGRCADCEGHGEHSNGIDSEICRRCNGSGSELIALQNIVDRVREKVSVARHALHLTGDLDARDLLHHITTAMEDQ